MIKKLGNGITTITGMLGIGGIGGAIENGESLLPALTALTICVVFALTVRGIENYEKWKMAEKKRIERNIRKRINRIDNCAYPSCLCR